MELLTSMQLPETVHFVPVRVISQEQETISEYFFLTGGELSGLMSGNVMELIKREKPHPVDAVRLAGFDCVRDYGLIVISDRLRVAVTNSGLTNVEFYPCVPMTE
jgi:hypothetical protein